MRNERETDQFVRDMLREIGFTRPWEQGGGPLWKRDALKGGSKSPSGNAEGKPEFVFESGEFVVIIEDKRDIQHTRHLIDGVPATEYPYRANYALNGAIHYAKTMLKNGIPHDGIFAVGVAGNEINHEIAVSYLSQGIEKQLDDLNNLDVFSKEEIGEYFNVQVLEKRPRAEVQLDGARKAAEDIHECMRNYGSVENERKAPLVSAILLALQNPNFDFNALKAESEEKKIQIVGWLYHLQCC